MTAMRDPDRQIRAFLGEGVTELSDRSYDAVRLAIDRTRQRTVFGPRRTSPMPAFIRPAALAAAFVGIAVMGVLLFNRSGLPPGVTPGPSGSAAASPPASTEASASPGLAYTWPGPLVAGTYSTPFTWDVPFEVRFKVPDGWAGRDIEVVRDPDLSVAVALVGNTSADPCAHTLADPPTGESIEDLAAALEAMPGLDASAPRQVTLAGYAGLVLDATVGPGAGCAPADFQLWVDSDAHLPVTPFGPPLWMAGQPNMTIWILDVRGTRLVISKLWSNAATPSDRAEQQAVVDSIELGPPTQSMSLGTCTLTVNLHGTASSGPPYRVTLEQTPVGGLNGPVPDPFPIKGPVAWLDWFGEGWTGLGRDGPGGSTLIPPPGATSTGFSTSTTVNGPQGSVVFDAPGTWWVRVSDGRLDQGVGCLRQFPVEVLPMPSG